MLLNTRHVADLFNISPSTVKKYSGMYGRFLSNNARPQNGAHRLFDTDDLKVFSFIIQQSKLGERHDNIIMALANGERADLPPQHGDYSLTIDKSEQLTMLQVRINQLQAEIEELRNERDKRIEAEAQNRLLRELLKEAQQELLRAQRGE